ncbi:MAG: phosphatidate cytidylyltransferase [Devosia sp.]
MQPRLLSAFVIVVVIGIALTLGGIFFAVGVGIVFGLTYREWEQMVTLKPVSPIGMALVGLVALSAIGLPVFGWVGALAPLVVAAIIAAVLGPWHTALWRIGGLAFFGLVIFALITLRGADTPGLIVGWFLGFVIALNDSGAYFSGRLIGGEKLFPAISPAKTWSGAIGGWVIGTLAGTIYWLIFVPGSPWWIGLLLAAATGLLGQVGDLTESGIKRRFRIKDSGDIIPGHGGLMDRLDSTTFAALFVLAVGAWHAGLAHAALGFLNW